MACANTPTHFTCPQCDKCLICDSHTHNPDGKGSAPYRPGKR